MDQVEFIPGQALPLFELKPPVFEGLDFDELVRLDFLYLERWSVFLDLTIMLKTIPAVIRARGAW